MDIAAVAEAGALLLATKGGEVVAGEAGRTAWSGFLRLARAVRTRFDGDSEAVRTLERAQDEPQDPARVEQLAALLFSYSSSDPGFRAELASLIDEAQSDPVGRVAVNISGNAHVNKVAAFSAAIHGNVTF
jgi:hypothetical protein